MAKCRCGDDGISEPHPACLSQSNRAVDHLLVEIVNDEARKYRVECLLLLRRQILATLDFDQRDAGHCMIFSRDQFRCPQRSAIGCVDEDVAVEQHAQMLDSARESSRVSLCQAAGSLMSRNVPKRDNA